MSKIIFLILLSTSAYSQSVLINSMERYPVADTAACLFLEVMNDSTVQWQHGFVVRSNGFISFGKTKVSREYLPNTSGVVTSPLFYKTRQPIKNYAIQVIIKPVGKPETNITPF